MKASLWLLLIVTLNFASCIKQVSKNSAVTYQKKEINDFYQRKNNFIKEIETKWNIKIPTKAQNAYLEVERWLNGKEVKFQYFASKALIAGDVDKSFNPTNHNKYPHVYFKKPEKNAQVLRSGNTRKDFGNDGIHTEKLLGYYEHQTNAMLKTYIYMYMLIIFTRLGVNSFKPWSSIKINMESSWKVI